MIKAMQALVALASTGLGAVADATVEALAQAPKVAARVARAVTDPYATQRAELREAGAFVAADGKRYRVGPCGYVPKSAQFDPVRRSQRRNRNGGAR